MSLTHGSLGTCSLSNEIKGCIVSTFVSMCCGSMYSKVILSPN